MVSARAVAKAIKRHGKIVTAYEKFMCQAPVKGDEEDSHSDGLIHPSSISGCMTRAVYTSLGFPLLGKVDARAIRIFALGTAVHRLLQKDLHKAGLLSVDEKGNPKVEVKIWVPEFHLTGHIDGIIAKHVHGCQKVLEIKSINSNALESLKEPKEEHKIQAGCYVFACKRMKELQDVDGVIYLYYGKNDSELVEFDYRVSDGLLATVEKKLREMWDMLLEFSKFQALPPPLYNDPAIAPCKWCERKMVCFSTFDRQAYADRVLPIMLKETANAAAQKAPAKAESPATAGRRLPPRRPPCVR
jgi:hypothetical protein